MRTCNKCLQQLQDDSFYVSNRTICKSCISKRDRKKYQEKKLEGTQNRKPFWEVDYDEYNRAWSRWKHNYDT